MYRRLKVLYVFFIDVLFIESTELDRATKRENACKIFMYGTYTVHSFYALRHSFYSLQNLNFQLRSYVFFQYSLWFCTTRWQSRGRGMMTDSGLPSLLSSIKARSIFIVSMHRGFASTRSAPASKNSATSSSNTRPVTPTIRPVKPLWRSSRVASKPFYSVNIKICKQIKR